MVVVAPDEETRAGAAQALREARIQTSLHYPCVADFAAFGAFSAAALPHSRAYARRAVTLPLYPTMTEDQVEDVCAVLLRAAANGAGRRNLARTSD
jgi:dTDP-4-amino-4,6-dideoxygalactose transaminase